MVVAGVFVALGLTMAASLSIRPEQHSRGVAVLVGLAFGGFAALPLYLWLYARRHVLWVDGEGLVHRGAWRIKRIRWRDVLSAQWAPHGRRALKLRTPRGRMMLDFGYYSLPDRVRLSLLLRRNLPAAVQTDWDAYSTRHLPRPIVVTPPWKELREMARATVIATAACMMIVAATKWYYGDDLAIGWWQLAGYVLLASACPWVVLVPMGLAELCRCSFFDD